MFLYIVMLVGIIAGWIGSISGFGIGSLLTPIFALKCDIRIAVAGVSIAHFLGTALRFWKWRKYINKRVLLSFGLTSAIGGLIGALFHNVFGNVILTIIFGFLLIFAGMMGLTGASERLRFSGPMAWMAGAISGIFGGMVGNQGGIRSAAMLGFNIKGKEFVATATGTALIVDMARMPVYFMTQAKDMFSIWPLILIASAGVLIGTEIGAWALNKIPEILYKRVVSAIILFIGIFVLIHR